MSSEYPVGIDLEWFAVDGSGFVAAFTSAGRGPIPASILRERHATSSVSAAVRGFPARGRGEMLVSLPRPDDFTLFSSRGLFAYDWSDAHRTSGFLHAYELLARPEHPIRIGEFPEELRSILARTRLESVSFSDCPRLTPESFVPCEIDR